MTLPKMEILEEFSSIPDVTFFETGTYTGTGINQAMKAGFSRVISLEPVEEFHQNCVKKFSERISNGTLRLVWGSSEDKFYDEIKSIKTPIVYWLDGHFQGGDSEAKNCPLQEEVAAILERGIRPNDVIMIDDVRLIKNQTSWKGHETDLCKELGKLSLNAPNHVSLFVTGHVESDVFILVPKHIAANTSHLLT